MTALRTGTAAAAIAAALLVSSGAARAWTYSVIYDFRSLRGVGPGRVIFDGAGNIYTITVKGGKLGHGTVVKLSPPAGGQTTWAETVLHTFAGPPSDGDFPVEITFDAAGDLYGLTQFGGSSGRGTAFRLAAPTPGHKAWKETILLNFDGPNGINPQADDGLNIDAAGNLYSTTNLGGAHGSGTVFELSPPAKAHGAWTQTILLNCTGADGWIPNGSLLFDSAGNIFSSMAYGGAYDNGVIYELSPPAPGGGAWKETVLYTFDVALGYHPNSGVIGDAAGNLYGTTAWGGSAGYGVVFELSPPAGGAGAWTYSVLHNFGGADGAYPFGGLTNDAAGNLYGVTTKGGQAGLGTVFELSPPAAGQTAWTETVLHSFAGPDGNNPAVDLTFDAAGNLFGSTGAGGTHNKGVLFELTP